MNVPVIDGDDQAATLDRLAQLEAQVADLQAWLAAVANDMLDRTA